MNLLVSGDVTDWVNEHFKDSNKILPIILKNGIVNGSPGSYNINCEMLSSDYTETDCFKVTSINALPAPGIGIDNSDPNDQCNLNLEDFMPQTDLGNDDGGSTGNDGGDNDNGGGTDNTNGDGGNDPSGGSTGD